MHIIRNVGTFGKTEFVLRRIIIRPSPTNPGYGYLWWLGEGWYGARGFGGQTITVFPEKEKIVVTQASVTDRPLSYDDIYFAEI